MKEQYSILSFEGILLSFGRFLRTASFNAI